MSVVQSPWLNIQQAAEYLHMRQAELARLVRSGEIESRRRGERGTFIHASWLDAWMLRLPSGADPIAVAARGQ